MAVIKCQFPAISTCDVVCDLVNVEFEKGKGESPFFILMMLLLRGGTC
mgnify:CR=1 FL=1